MFPGVDVMSLTLAIFDLYLELINSHQLWRFEICELFCILQTYSILQLSTSQLTLRELRVFVSNIQHFESFFEGRALGVAPRRTFTMKTLATVHFRLTII